MPPLTDTRFKSTWAVWIHQYRRHVLVGIGMQNPPHGINKADALWRHALPCRSLVENQLDRIVHQHIGENLGFHYLWTFPVQYLPF